MTRDMLVHLEDTIAGFLAQSCHFEVWLRNLSEKLSLSFGRDTFGHYGKALEFGLNL